MTNTFDRLPSTWQTKIKQMRAENARLRVGHRELQQQVAELRAALAAVTK